MATPATLGDSFQSFFDAIDEFVSNLAAVQWGALVFALLALVAFGLVFSLL